MTPKEMLKRTKQLAKELEQAQKLTVKVGLPASKLSGKAYQNGISVLQVGAAHEFGAGVPQRSFLRVPFEVKKKELEKFIANQFHQVVIGESKAKVALGRVGVFASNISKNAFRENGYGQWQELNPKYAQYKQKKGKSQTLIWSGILRSSITWSVE